ncbi:MAG: hypothetical protein LBV80_04375 [Deltaproteobacteria bacterium]|jgi:hypothetical protein|nr:hypothetical protein [Deltaproteobacteria bacterium]
MKTNQLLKLTLLGTSLLALSGCGLFSGSTDAQNEAALAAPRLTAEAVSVSSYTPASISNYKLGREYAAAGRFELAREHYLLALAAANDKDLQDALVAELHSVDLMIKSLR